MITTAHADDLPILEGLMEGQREATELVYSRCFNQVRIMIENHSGSEDDARDVFQDALIALYKRLHKSDFNLTCKLSSYIQIMCRNMWRSKTRNVQMTTSTDTIAHEVVDIDADVVEQMAGSARRNLMFKHFSELSEDCRKILEQFFAKTPMKEIAAMLDTSEGYIKKRKHVCKSRLMANVQSDPLFKELAHG